MHKKLILLTISFLLFINSYFLYKLYFPKIPIDPIEQIKTLMTNCEETGLDRCYEDATNSLLKKYSHDLILESLIRHEKESVIFNKCHSMTHYIGRNLYESKKNIPDAYLSCNSSCWGGCYHGVLEAYLHDKDYDIEKESETIKNEVLVMCETQRNNKYPKILYECMHGIGHAVMFVTGMNIKKSLDYCDVIEKMDERHACFGGVFMEFSSSSTESSHGLSVPDEDPLYPCSVLPEKYLSVCYQYQSSLFMFRENANWDLVIDDCEKVPEKYQSGCFLFIGSNQAGFTTDINFAFSVCDKVSKEDMRTECIRGIIIGNGARYVGDFDRLNKMCEIVDQKYFKICVDESLLNMKLWGWNAEMITDMCDKNSSSIICQ